MAKRRKWQKQNGPVFYRGWKDWEVGDWLEGTLIKIGQDKKFKKPNYHIKVEDKNFDVEYEGRELEIGGTLILNNCGSVEKALESSELGDPCRFEYNGVAEITSGDWEGSEAHDVTVYLEEGAASGSDEEDDDEDDL